MHHPRVLTTCFAFGLAAAGCATVRGLAGGAASGGGPGSVPNAGSIATGPTYDPPAGDARNDFGGAIQICAGWKGHSPGDLADFEYHDYVDKRDAAIAADPKITSWNTKYLGYVPSEMFPWCEKMAKDYASGVDADKQPMNDLCKRVTDSRLNSIIDDYYPGFQKNGPEQTIVWFARKDLEAARWYMYYGEGFNPQGRGCAMNDRYKPGFAPIKAKFAKAEALVQEMEAAKGVRFVKVENGNAVVYVDAKTGATIAQADHI